MPMRKTYRLIGLQIYGCDALKNEFHDLGSYETEAEAVAELERATYDEHDMVLLVPAWVIRESPCA